MAASPAGAGEPVFDNPYARLPGEFYAKVAPTPVRAPGLVRLNGALAEELGLDAGFLASQAGVAMLAGNRLPQTAEPLAMAYAGHQFGHFVPLLGDGRAVLLGEVIDRRGRRREVQLKGAGRTPFSRNGDGRAGLGPVLREYVVSEAMAGLGIPTTRALAMVTTGEPIYRPGGPEPGAVLTRVATSHVRVGTFELFARHATPDAVRTLADHVIERLLPIDPRGPERHRALLDHVIERQAELIARWMLTGFVHGVMNTDNMSVAGETIDYGPCAFMDAYDPDMVKSSIDHAGRYAYGQQPGVGLWNLARFAECLLPLLDDDAGRALAIAEEALRRFPALYEAHYREGLARKLGLAERREGDDRLAQELLACMAAGEADFTTTFRRLSNVSLHDPATDAEVREGFNDPAAFDAWARTWRERLAREGRDDAARQREMRAVNPAFIPRTHRVNQAIEAAVHAADLTPLEELLEVVARPYEDHPSRAAYAAPPEPHEVVQQTFCGT